MEGSGSYMELKKLNLSFRDLAHALKIDPQNREFQLNLKEVTSLLGWSPDFVEDALEVVQEEELFKGSVQNEKEENKRKERRGQRKEGILTCVPVLRMTPRWKRTL
ncbi:hypothetical protein SOVF_185110 isoform B [Spinacia oleracea]|nr:hypothetical protein SOVF_185110 isoform B [Spinacia oleracea]